MIWHGSTVDVGVVNIGVLALIRPLLDRLEVANLMDRHIDSDPQLEFTHGKVLATLLAARLAQPMALMNVAEWASGCGAEMLFGIPPEKLNDDRLGRSLDAFFEHRHSIAAEVTLKALEWTDTNLNRIHFDPTDITFYGRYDSSQPRPEFTDSCRGDHTLRPAHLSRNYSSGELALQLGITAVVDDLGALPIACHCYDGNRNGHTGIAEQVQLLRHHLPLPPQMLMISDRGTFSAAHLARLREHDQSALCAVPWQDYLALYDRHREQLQWQRASFLSQEQQRRRRCCSTLPIEQYRLAVVKHELLDPKSNEPMPCRVIFVHSSAAEKEERQRRQKNIEKIRTGLEQMAAKLLRGHPCSTPESIQRQIVRLMGKRDAARYFQWHLVLLTAEEQAALPRPRKGFKLASHRLVWSFDEVGATAAEVYDGRSALVTTASIQHSADELFRMYKQQAYVERMNHQLKTPLEVRPVFLKSPQRVESLICLMHLALLAQQSAERVFRKHADTKAGKENRTTVDQLWRAFQVCGVLIENCLDGTVAHAVRLSTRQRMILSRLGFPTVSELLRTILPAVPTD